MTIRYIDYATGDDSTGNGTPFKTITRALSGLAGGDEVRIAKTWTPTLSPAIQLTMTFEQGSASAPGDLTGAVPDGSIVGSDTMGYWIFTNPSYDGANTSWDLGTFFPLTTGSYDAKKVTTADTPAPPAQAAVMELLDASGTSSASRIKISGGWSLATQTQDGETWLRSPSSQWGMFIKHSSGYFEIEDLAFVDHYTAIKMASDAVRPSNIKTVGCFVGFDLTSCYGATILGYGSYRTDYSFNLNSTSSNIVSGVKAIACYRVAYFSSCHSNSFSDIEIYGPGGEGMIMEDSHLNVFRNLTIRNASAYGLVLNNASGNKFYNTDIHLDDMSSFMIWPSENLNATFSINNFFEDLSIRANDLGGGISIDRSTIVMRRPVIDLQGQSFTVGTSPGTEVRLYKRDNVYGAHQVLCAEGVIQTVTDPARSGIAWKMSPNSYATSTDRPLILPAFQIGVAAHTEITVTVYVYLNADTSVRLFCRGGQLVGIPSDAASDTVSSPTGTWTPLSLTVTPSEAGVLEFEVQCWGAGAGTEYAVVDDLEVS